VLYYTKILSRLFLYLNTFLAINCMFLDTGSDIMWKPYQVKSELNINAFFSAFIRSCTDEYFFGGESHDFWEFTYVMKGSVCMSVDEKIIELEENQIVFHKPMAFHSMRTYSEKSTDLFIMSFSCVGDFIERFSNSIYSLNHSQKASISKIIELLRKENDDPDAIFEPINSLESLLKKPIKFNYLKNLTENFLISLSETGEVSTTLVKNAETLIYADALRIIDENICKKLTVSELAKKSSVSVSYLKKIFAKYNGLGIHEYILKNKISLAKQMLLEGSSVTEISEKLAFSSQNYFSTAFKREVGISPGQYKTKIY